jgi:hypothetical protein
MDERLEDERWNQRPLEGHENAQLREMIKKVKKMELMQQHHTWLGWVAWTFLKVLGAVFTTVAAGYALFQKLWVER